MACTVEGIPKRLHRNGRKPDIEFDGEEQIYIRIPPALLQEEKPLAAAFRTKRQSGNRERYSKTPDDVLYNINAKNKNEHFHHWGIVKIKVKTIQSNKYNHPEIDEEYTFKLSHEPEECMYPHSEIHIFLDGKEGKLNPSTLKTLLKDYYRDNCIVEKRP